MEDHGDRPKPPLQRAGWGYDPPPPSKAPATIALLLAILPLCLTQIGAIVLAIVVLAGPGNGRDRGRGRAVGALVVSGGWVAVLVALTAASVATDAERDSSGEVSQRGDVAIINLRVGDCVVDDFTGELRRAVAVAPCDEPHRLEAYAIFELSRGDFPGQSSVDRLAEGGCIKRFRDFVGTSYAESSLDMHYVGPSSMSWKLGDREVLCMVSTGAMTRGTLEGAEAGESDPGKAV